MRSRKPLALLLLSLLPVWPAAGAQLAVQVGRITAPDWQIANLDATLTQDGRLSLSTGLLSATSLPAPLQSTKASCRLAGDANGYRCSGGKLALRGDKAGSVDATFSASFRDASHWDTDISGLSARLSGSSKDERYVAEALRLTATTRLQRRGTWLEGRSELRLLGGQTYADPVFNDFSAHPLTAHAQWRLQAASRELQLSEFGIIQPGIAELGGSLQTRLDQPAANLKARIRIAATDLATLAELYLKPFLSGSRIDNIGLGGHASADLQIEQGAPSALRLQLQDSTLEVPKLGFGFAGLSGTLHWAPTATADSRLQWQGAHVGKLQSGASTLDFATSDRDFRLLRPLRLDILDGALNVNRLALNKLGQPGMSAAFDADIEPIDLAQLCRVFGWPEFGGQLSGKLPGLRLENDLLSLDGALTARAFDGDIRLGDLRVIQPFGVLPRVAADIRLRNLDLERVTSAFSFGRIEGRLDGDVTGLRLIGWKPVAMDARIATPPGDRSRHRISQRAIDSISAAGGGPTGILKRSALRLFDDFAYERVGWSCKLDNGICEMDGIEPAKDGGYVLVKGRLLPRIDVVGFSRRVGWETFLSQLKAAMQADHAEIR